MNPWIWTSFLVLVFFLLALDLGVLNRKAHVIGVREAFRWSLFWVSLALLFDVFVYFLYQRNWGGGAPGGLPLSGAQAALQFLTGYVVEKSLSLDNIFVIALIFTYLEIPRRFQHSVLFWGILGALLLRGIMILGGTVLVRRFGWATYVFGGLLLVSAARLLLEPDDRLSHDENFVLRAVRSVFPVTDGLEGGRFLARAEGSWALTPLFVSLLVVELSDVLFAFDSIPAVFAVTRDPFLVFTSNVFAILGLRSLYFALAAALERLRYLKTSIVYVLLFVGGKILVSHHYSIPALASLAVILVILSIGLAASLALPGHQIPPTRAYSSRGIVLWHRARRKLLRDDSARNS